MFKKYHFLQLHVPVQLPCYDLIPVFMLITQVSSRFYSVPQMKLHTHFKWLSPPEPDGRYVQRSDTISPQLIWFAITSNSSFYSFKLQKLIGTTKMFKDLLQISL